MLLLDVISTDSMIRHLKLHHIQVELLNQVSFMLDNNMEVTTLLFVSVNITEEVAVFWSANLSGQLATSKTAFVIFTTTKCGPTTNCYQKQVHFIPQGVLFKQLHS